MKKYVLVLLLFACTVAAQAQSVNEACGKDSVAYQKEERKAKATKIGANAFRKEREQRALKGRLAQPLYKDTYEDGKVVVRLTIDKEGKVIDAEIAEGTTVRNESQLKATIEAAKKNRFTAGDSVEQITIIQVSQVRSDIDY